MALVLRFFFVLIACKFSHLLEVKTDIASHGIAQLIDSLTDQYHMRFTVVTVGASLRVKDLACKIVSVSRSPVNLKHYIETNNSEIIDFDEPYVILHESADIYPEFYGMTKLLTYRRKLTLAFDLNYMMGSEKADEVEQKIETKTFPHDIYLISHSPRNGSLWLMGNELFFNKTCDSSYHSINFFNSSEMKWNNSKFMNEYRNFHGCRILAGEENWYQNEMLRNYTRNFRNYDFIASILNQFRKLYNTRIFEFSLTDSMFKPGKPGTKELDEQRKVLR